MPSLSPFPVSLPLSPFPTLPTSTALPSNRQIPSNSTDSPSFNSSSYNSSICSNGVPNHSPLHSQDDSDLDLDEDRFRDLTSRGTLHIKVVDARNLPVPSPVVPYVPNSHPRLYCVLQFEKSDFVTREAVFPGSSSSTHSRRPTATSGSLPHSFASHHAPLESNQDLHTNTEFFMHDHQPSFSHRPNVLDEHDDDLLDMDPDPDSDSDDLHQLPPISYTTLNDTAGYRRPVHEALFGESNGSTDPMDAITDADADEQAEENQRTVTSQRTITGLPSFLAGLPPQSQPRLPVDQPSQQPAPGTQPPAPTPVWNHEATFDVHSLASDISISLWDRSPLTSTSPTPEQQCQSQLYTPSRDREELFLGSARFSPPKMDGRTEERWIQLMGKDGTVGGDVKVVATFRAAAPRPLGPEDFDLLKVIGKGSFGKVLQVRKTDTARVYAMKILPKRDIVDRKEVAHTLSERNVLIMASSPFLVGLKFSFQTPEKLYLVLDYMSGGELFYHLQREVVFREERARFYAAELVLAIEHLHNHDVVYRDLKPENILLDSTGHIALTDFGLCKENVGYDAVTNTFCGTAEYLAPEILTGQGYGKAVDWWSLGILFYEMTTGLPPFYSENTNVMYNKILHTQVQFPAGYSREAESLVRGLLDRDPKRRLGSPPLGALAIKRHPFFRTIDWDRLLRKEVRPPHKPMVASETDTSNFDPQFTEALPVDSLPNSNVPPLSQTVQDHFIGFSYQGESPLFGGRR
ncbi:hypothetical protein HDU93_000344 [Gonapodya sp. JEL0774]|nr:hypothetical protein HDU93_000344 [Gonapodya sp. JEL0774]